MISLLCITDGRKGLLEKTLTSFARNVTGQISHSVLVDDSANSDYAEWLENAFSTWFDRIVHHTVRKGFAGAIQSGWDALPKCEFVFWLEDDFIWREEVNLDNLVCVLKERPYLAQIVLKRQPWNSAEIEAGDIINLAPNDFTEQHLGEFVWTEHRRNFSTNPSLMPYLLTRLGFPQEVHDNERLFSDQLKKMGYRFAYWGKKNDPPKVEHIGYKRIGIGY